MFCPLLKWGEKNSSNLLISTIKLGSHANLSEIALECSPSPQREAMKEEMEAESIKHIFAVKTSFFTKKKPGSRNSEKVSVLKVFFRGSKKLFHTPLHPPNMVKIDENEKKIDEIKRS